MPRSRTARGSRRRGRTTTRREWIGGRLTLPFFVTDRDEPYRPELVVWFEVPPGLVVGQDLVAPEDVPGAAVRALRAALEQPLAGPPRRPDVIRVADHALAAEVREAVSEEIPVTVAPTPELDELLELMVESMPEGDDEESYLEGGRIPPEAVASLFTAAQTLYILTPWKVATDDRVLRMDIPALGVEGACVSIIGNLGQSLGLIIFPSFAGYVAFRRLAPGIQPALERPLDMGTDWLALSFERGADLAPTLRREVGTHAWPVAAADAYPRLERVDRDAVRRPLSQRDYRIAAACATSLVAFFVKHGDLLATDEPEPVCESFFDREDLEVRFTLPYEAFPLFDVEASPDREPASATRRGNPTVGRNDPCPCGSGRKYKKCHLPLDRQKSARRSEGQALHGLDARLVEDLLDYGFERFGDVAERAMEAFLDPEEALTLALPWSVYGAPVEDRPLVDWFLEERGRRLSPAERAWLEAQRQAWLSAWEVTAVEPGETMTLRDLLSNETRTVEESRASQSLVARDVILARVVDHEDVSLLCATHPRGLPPGEAAEVVQRARKWLRRRQAVPVERLRDGRFGRYLIQRWEDAVAELDARRRIPRQLQNTDGDPILFTVDHFAIAPGARAAVEERLAALPDVEPQQPGENPPEYVFTRPGNPMHQSWENTLIGRAWISGETLHVETNSRERADSLRERLEAACGDHIGHRAREHTDPLSSAVPHPQPGAKPEPPTPEQAQLLLEFKRHHYAGWLDSPLPALDGQTPREAARTKPGRAAVDVLLKEMENSEQRSASGAAFDFSPFRRELGLE